MYINGKGLSHTYPVIPKVPGIQLVLEATCYSLLIRIKLKLIREILLVFPSCGILSQKWHINKMKKTKWSFLLSLFLIPDSIIVSLLQAAESRLGSIDT